MADGDQQQPYSLAGALSKFRVSAPATTAPKHPAALTPPPAAEAKPPVAEKPKVQQYSLASALTKFQPQQKPMTSEERVRAVAAQYGVDPDLAARLAHQESGFNQRATSRAGARGVMQLMPPTASRYGVDLNDEEQNISGGVRYLHDLINRYDTTDKALAAYNWGEEHVDRAIEQYGENWLAHAPEETRKYVAAISSGGYWTQRGQPTAPMFQIYGRRGAEPRIGMPAPEFKPKEKPGVLSTLLAPVKEGYERAGLWASTKRSFALDWWEKAVPYKYINAVILGSLSGPGGIEREIVKAAVQGEGPERPKLEKFEHLVAANIFRQGSDPVNIAFMFFPMGKALQAVGMSTKAALYTRAAIDTGFSLYAAHGAYEGVKTSIQQFERGEIPEGFATLLDVGISAGFGVLGARGAIHQVRSGMSLGMMDRLARESYGRPWEELPIEQRGDIATRVSEATAKYSSIIQDMSDAERKRDIAAYVKAAEKLGVTKPELEGLRKAARGAKPAPEERISGMIERLKESLKTEEKPDTPEGDVAKEKEKQILDFLFEDNPAKVKDVWNRWQAIRGGEAGPLTIEAKAEVERAALQKARDDLMREVVDAEKNLRRAIYEEASRTERERASMRGDLEAQEQRHKDRINQANKNLLASSPVLQRRAEAAQPGRELPKMEMPEPTKRPYEEPPPNLEAAPREDPMLIKDATHPYIGEERYRLENLIGHVNDFMETRKRPTSDAEIREELERLAKEFEKEEFLRTADMAEEEEKRLAEERGWSFKGRRAAEAEPLTLEVTPDEQAHRETQHKLGQAAILGQLKRTIQDEAARLSENIQAATQEEAAAAQKAVEEAHKAVAGIEGAQREILDDVPEDDRPDPDRDGAAATIPDEFLGNTVPVKTSRGYSVDAQYAVLEAGAVQASHDTDMDPNPGYPTRVQPRNREAAFSAAHRDEVAGTLDPNQLAENFSANHGAPMVGDDLFVESGNLRTIVLKMLYKLDLPKAAEYRKWLEGNLGRFGIEPEVLQKLRNPVLVRIRRTSLGDMGMDRAQFARDANAPFEAQMSAVEQAKADAAAMSFDLLGLLRPGETGEIFTAANQPFIQTFFDQVISPAARGGYMLTDGGISQQGIRRVENAVFAKAYPGAEAVLEKLLDDPDNNIRNAARAMFAAAPKFAQLNDLIASGKVKDLSLSSDVAEFARKLSNIREARKQTVRDYLNTPQMFGADISPAAFEILRVFNDYSRRPMIVADVFNAYAEEAMRVGRTDQTTMFGVEDVSKDQILRGAVNRVAGGGLFPGVEGESAGATLPVAPGGTPAKGESTPTPTPSKSVPRGVPEAASGPPEKPLEMPVEAEKRSSAAPTTKEGAKPSDMAKAEDLGRKYGLELNTAMDRMTPNVYQYQDSVTGGSFSIPKEGFSEEALKEKLEKFRASIDVESLDPLTKKKAEETRKRMGLPEPEGGIVVDSDAVQRLIVDYNKTSREKNGQKKLKKRLQDEYDAQESRKRDEVNLREAEWQLKNNGEDAAWEAIRVVYSPEELEAAEEVGLDTPEKVIAKAKESNRSEMTAGLENIKAIEQVLGNEPGTKRKPKPLEPTPEGPIVKAEPTIEGKVVEPPPNLEEPKKGYGEKNTIVSKDRYEELKKRMLKKGLGQSSAGIDPTLLPDIAEMMVYHVEAGIREFKDVAARVLREMGDWVQPYLQPAWDSIHEKPTDETRPIAEKLKQVEQLGLFEKPKEVSSEPRTIERGKAPDAAPSSGQRGGTEPRAVGAPGREGAREYGGPGGSVRGVREAKPGGRRAERERAIRDVPDARLAPTVERITPPAWEDVEWKKTLSDAGLPNNARIPSRRLYRNISDKLIFTGQDAVADYVLSELVDGSGGVVVGTSTGTGKCLATGTLVLMYDGRTKKVEEVCVGDRLMGPDSKPRNVLSLAYGSDEMYRITPTKGEPYEVNKAHILSVKMTYRGPQHWGYDGKIFDVSVLDYLEKSIHWKHCAKGYRVGVEFQEKEVSLPPYFIGVWLGDGSSHLAAVTTVDPEIISYMDAMAEWFGLDIRIDQSVHRCPTYVLTSHARGKNLNLVHERLKQMGVLRNKHIPFEYKINSRAKRLEVLAGLIDADGSLNCGGYELVFKRRILAEDVTFVARSLGFAAYIRPCRKTCTNSKTRKTETYYRVFISGDVSQIPVHVRHKKAGPRKQKKDVLLTGIKVQPIGKGEYYGFELDSDGRFLLGDFTVTHNTYISNAVLRQLTEMQPEFMKHVLVLTTNQDLIKDFKSTASKFGNEVQDYPKGGVPQKDGTFIATYAAALGREGIDQFPWDLVISDESGSARRWWESRTGNLVKNLGEKAKKMMYLSATPFHNAVEVGYATKLGLWKGSTFEEWVGQFGVHRDPSTGEWRGHSNPRRVEKLRQQLMERGQMIDWPRNMDGYHSNFAVVPIRPEGFQKMGEATRAWRMVTDYYRKKQSPKMVMAANGNAVTFMKHLIESFRLPEAIDLARQSMKQGYQTIIFSERRSKVDDLYDFVKQADEAYGGQIDKMMPRIEGFSDQFRKAFGEDIAIYTGELQPKERREQLDAFNSGKKKVMFSTYSAGGIGVSMHDLVGNSPRLVIYLGPPWSGVMFDQAIGRPWRFGTMSNVTSIFLFSNSKPEVDLVAGKISPRMQSLRAIVNGIRDEDPIIRGLQNIDKALEYEHGKEQKVSADSFFEKISTSGLMSHKDVKLPDATEHYYKGMKIKKRVIPMDKPPEEPSGGGGTTLYSMPIFDPEVWKKYIIKDIAEMFSKRVDPSLPEKDRGAAQRIAEEVFGSKEFRKASMENLGTADAASKFTKQVGTMAADAAERTEGDPAPVIHDVLDNARKWLETVPGGRDGTKLAQTASRAGSTVFDHMLVSGRGIIRKLARQAGVPEIGNELVNDIMEYHTQHGLIAGPWEGKFLDIRKKYDLKAQDFEHVWDVVEGEDEARHPRFEEAATDIRKINREIQQAMVQNGVTVTSFNRLTGKPARFAFSSRPRPNYMPRIYDEEVFQFGSKKREQIIERLMQSRGISRVEAELELSKRDNPDTPLAGNIERAREQDIPGYERTVNAYMKYLDGAAEVIARTKVFGQNREKLRGKIGTIDSREARQDIDEIFDQLLSRNRFSKGPADIVRLASDWTAIMKMPFSAIKMIAHMPKAAVMTNTRSFIQALLNVMPVIGDYQQAYRIALGSGAVLHQSRVDMMRELGVSQRLGDKVLRLYQVPEADTLSRVLSDQTARVFMSRFALPELIVNPKSDYRRILREHFGLSDGAINRAIEEKKWAKEDLNRGGARTAVKSQGTWDPTELPPGWREIPKTKAGQTLAALFRTSVMLKSYVYKNGVFFRDVLYNEVVHHRNIRPLVPFMLIFPALGEAIEDLNEAVRGRPERFKELFESKTYEPANLVKRVIEDIAFNTATNLATIAVEGVTRFHENPKMEVGRTVAGPFLGDVSNFTASFLQAIKDLMDGNSETLNRLWHNLGRDVESTSPMFRTMSKGVEYLERGGNQEPEGISDLELSPIPE